MGASSSTEQVSVEQREAESLAASIGALPMLQKAFSMLSDSQTGTIPLQSLQQCFSLIFENPRYESNFRMLLSHLGPSIVDQFFSWSRKEESSQRKAIYDPPDINHLALSVVLPFAKVSNHLDIWDCDMMRMDMELPA
ncbi:hypothetical protein U1Q18_030302 [Sarracenia purpurea var. burkii]